MFEEISSVKMKWLAVTLLLMAVTRDCAAECTTEKWDNCLALFDPHENQTSSTWIPIYDNGTAVPICNTMTDMDNCIFPFLDHCPVYNQKVYWQFSNAWYHLCTTREEYLTYVDCFNRSHDADDECVAHYETELSFITDVNDLCGLYWTLLTCISGNIEAVCGAEAAAWQREYDRLFFEVEGLSYGLNCPLSITTTTPITTTIMTTEPITTDEATSSFEPTTTASTTTVTQGVGNSEQQGGDSHATIVGIGIGIGVLLGAILVVVVILLYLKLRGKKRSTSGGPNTVSAAIDGPVPVYYNAQNGSILHGLPSYSAQDPMTKERPPEYDSVPNQQHQPTVAPQNETAAARPSQPPSLHIDPRLQQLLQQHRSRVQPPPSVDT